ncbi:MAG TPA: M48 family metallopeptidase [Pyrinomonadaceae bacterium]|nr:M48 family metallopeptidase [Pyrinomonadaceae bacterium]
MTQIKPTMLYKLKLFLLALVGYCYILLLPAIFLVLLGLLLWSIITGKGLYGPLIFIEILLLILAGKFVQELWVKVRGCESQDPPLEEEKAPKLFETIREIRRAIHGPQLHKVVLTDQFDLVLTPVPRLGLFGWSRYELDIGMPLMHVLTPAQFRALLTHELGHFSGTPLDTWIYQAREVWTPLHWRLNEQQRGGAWLFNLVFRRYVNYFSRYSFAFARTREYEADRLAAEITTAEVTADALIRFEYGMQIFYQYEPKFKEVLSTEFSLPVRVAEMTKALRSESHNEEALRWLKYSLSAEARTYNTHPALKDRLRALGQEPRLPTPISEFAADVYFGDFLDELTQQLIADWEKRAREFYPDRPEEDAGPAAEILKRAREAANRDQETAVLLYRELLRLDQDHAPANLALGTILLSEKNAEGIHFVKRAMDLDAANIYYGSNLIFNYLMKIGDPVGAAPYQSRMTELHRIYENATAERTQASFVDSFTSNDLPEDEVQQIRQELAKCPRIKEAYLVRKEVQYVPEAPLYVMGLVFDRRWFDGSDEDLSFAKRLPRAQTNPRELYVLVLDHRNRRVGKMIRNVSNSLIYRRASNS